MTTDTPSAAGEPETTDAVLLDMYARMVRIREFETTVQKLFKRGTLPGFVHLYSGEEAVAVGVCSALRRSDRITSTHRGHGHLIAKGADVSLMLAELLGRATGYCAGKGGSMHIVDYDLGILGANGIVGGGIPIATGSALADRVLDRDGVTVAFFGDGASNQGVLFEALNLAAVWTLPVIFVCENNHYTEWMRTETVTAGQIADRATPFGVPGVTVDGNDVLAVRAAASAAAETARTGGGPALIEAETYRHFGHNEGEEVFSGNYRAPEEIDAWRMKDPIAAYRARLIVEFSIDQEDLGRIDEEEHARVADGLRFAQDSPMPAPADALNDLFAEVGGR